VRRMTEEPEDRLTRVENGEGRLESDTKSATRAADLGEGGAQDMRAERGRSAGAGRTTRASAVDAITPDLVVLAGRRAQARAAPVTAAREGRCRMDPDE